MEAMKVDLCNLRWALRIKSRVKIPSEHPSMSLKAFCLSSKGTTAESLIAIILLNVLVRTDKTVIGLKSLGDSGFSFLGISVVLDFCK